MWRSTVLWVKSRLMPCSQVSYKSDPYKKHVQTFQQIGFPSTIWLPQLKGMHFGLFYLGVGRGGDDKNSKLLAPGSPWPALIVLLCCSFPLICKFLCMKTSFFSKIAQRFPKAISLAVKEIHFQRSLLTGRTHQYRNCWSKYNLIWKWSKCPSDTQCLLHIGFIL